MRKHKFHFGWKKSPFDERDYNLRNFIPQKFSLKAVLEKNWEYPYPETLDQKSTNHCVGFSMANFGVNMPTHTPFKEEDAHAFYYECKKFDGDPQGEEGTNMRSAARALKLKGVIPAYAFAYDIASIKWWVLNQSPVMIGTIWTTEMFSPDSNNVISVGGDVAGGHAYLINEWRADNMVGIQNSWGEFWGIKGKAYISSANLEKLLAYGGEAITAVEIEKQRVKKEKCFLFEYLQNAMTPK